MSGFFKALRAYFQSFHLINRNGWWGWMLIPGLLSFLVMLFLIWLGFGAVEGILNQINAESWPNWTMQMGLASIIEALVKIIVVLLIFFSYKHIVLIISAPFLMILAEKVAAKLDLKAQKPIGAMESIWRALVLNAKFAVYSILWILLAFVASFIPLFGSLLFILISFLSQAYYSGAGLLDFGLEARGFGAESTMKVLDRNRSAVWGIGTCFTLTLMIPVLGWLLAPAYATVAGTILASDLD